MGRLLRRLISGRALPIVPSDDPRWQRGGRDLSGRYEVFHLDGVPWHEAPIPPLRHQCAPQTRAWVRYFTPVNRCSCGAANYNGSPWMDRNSRRPVETDGGD